MMFKECVRCGHGNESGAGVCEQCDARLDPGRWSPAYAPAHAAGEVPAAAPPPEHAVRPFDPQADVLAPTVRLYREHLVPVGKIVLAAVPTQAALDYFAAQPAGPSFAPVMLAWLGSFAVGSLVTGALVHAVLALLRTGQSPPLLESFAFGLRRWWKVMLCSVLVGLLVGAASLLLCLPGVILMVIYAVAVPAAAVEDLGPVAAMERSSRLTSGARWPVFGSIFVLWVFIIGVSSLIAFTAGPGPGEGARLIYTVVSAAVNQLLYSAFTILSLFIYLSLRAGRGETDAPDAPEAPALER